MEERPGACPEDCGIPDLSRDNYCRECGMYVADVREAAALIPVTSTSQAIEPLRSPLPAPVKRAATAIAVGAAVQVGITLAGRYLAAQAAKKALDGAVRTPAPRRAARATRSVLPDDVAAIAETLIVRRVWIRRP